MSIWVGRETRLAVQGLTGREGSFHALACRDYGTQVVAGVIAAVKELGVPVPIVIRMKGTNVDEGKKMLAESGLNFTNADTMADAAVSVVALAGGAR